ncbi:transposase [Streptomyces tauricus]|uniref:transposase n=1 Tax=Streptomyces tauricus TaxID=68274 RepID=UPI0038001055
MDWKYCLGLELDDPGFDFSVLSEFRDRMAQGDRADRLLAAVVERLVAAGLVKRHGRMRTDSTHVLAAVRKLNRVELVAETLRAALEAIAETDERWLAPLVTSGWAERYGRPVRYDRLPKAKEERRARRRCGHRPGHGTALTPARQRRWCYAGVGGRYGWRGR